MKQPHFIAATILALSCTLAACSQSPPGTADDRAVLAAALLDFSQWDRVTFGDLKGVLAVKPQSFAYPELSVKSVIDTAPEIHNLVSDELASAYAMRNHTSVPIFALIEGLGHFQKVGSPESEFVPPLRPRGAKAIGSLGLPGYSADGKRALLEIEHSWSIHGAVVTYVLEKVGGKWRIVARDQSVHL